MQFHEIHEISKGSAQEIVDKNIDSYHNTQAGIDYWLLKIE